VMLGLTKTMRGECKCHLFCVGLSVRTDVSQRCEKFTGGLVARASCDIVYVATYQERCAIVI